MKAQILSILNRYPGLSDEEVAAKAGLPADQVRAVRASADRRADLLRKMLSLSDEEIDTLEECLEFVIPLFDNAADPHDPEARSRYERALALRDNLFPESEGPGGS